MFGYTFNKFFEKKKKFGRFGEKVTFLLKTLSQNVMQYIRHESNW